MRPLASRQSFLAIAQALHKSPYVWFAKGDIVGRVENRAAIWTATPALVFDCSGFVTYCLWKAGGPDIRRTHATSALWRDLAPTATPVAGDLAFYQRHVVICLGGPGAQVIGANGGDSRTTSIEQSIADGAGVSLKKSPNYRGGLRGFRSTASWFQD